MRLRSSGGKVRKVGVGLVNCWHCSPHAFARQTHLSVAFWFGILCVWLCVDPADTLSTVFSDIVLAVRPERRALIFRRRPMVI